VKGHLHGQRQNVRSTKPKQSPSPKVEPSPDPAPSAEPTPAPSADESNPAPSANEPRTHSVYAATLHVSSGRIDTDLTGRFPVSATSGNKYIFLLYHYDSNVILTEALRNRSDNEILRAYNKLHQYLADRGCHPMLQCLDNEASATLKRAIRDKNIYFQLVPPHQHRRLAAERAIQTFKNHFVAILCGTHPEFPLRLWDKLLPQAQLTLNLLRQSRMNPRLSAHSFLNGPFNFNRTPLAPVGTKVIVHENPSIRGTWDAHGVDGWYIGYAPIITVAMKSTSQQLEPLELLIP
jgi:hypothetical protein